MWVVTAFLAVLLAGSPTRAQPTSAGAGAATTESELRAERDRLRHALDGANREISELKRSSRGVTDEYRLRRKLAEAEDLARRLTAAEARLAGPAPKPALPTGDFDRAPASPNALRARADVMADDAGRLIEQATRLERAAVQIRRRATLRGRARQLERDPFAGVAGSKRLLIIRGATADLSAGGNSTRTGSSEGATAGDATTTSDTGRSSGGQTAVAPGGESAPPPGDSSGAGATSAPTSAPPPSSDPSGPAPTSTSTPPAGETPTPTAAPTPPTADPTPTPATSARALVDPGTLAELRRLESGGRSLADAARMERLAAELHKRARTLSEQARVLRDRASER